MKIVKMIETDYCQACECTCETCIIVRHPLFDDNDDIVLDSDIDTLPTASASSTTNMPGVNGESKSTSTSSVSSSTDSATASMTSSNSLHQVCASIFIRSSSSPLSAVMSESTIVYQSAAKAAKYATIKEVGLRADFRYRLSTEVDQRAVPGHQLSYEILSWPSDKAPSDAHDIDTLLHSVTADGYAINQGLLFIILDNITYSVDLRLSKATTSDNSFVFPCEPIICFVPYCDIITPPSAATSPDVKETKMPASASLPVSTGQPMTIKETGNIPYRRMALTISNVTNDDLKVLLSKFRIQYDTDPSLIPLPDSAQVLAQCLRYHCQIQGYHRSKDSAKIAALLTWDQILLASDTLTCKLIPSIRTAKNYHWNELLAIPSSSTKPEYVVVTTPRKLPTFFTLMDSCQ
jgi:hypothetical protein